jgi:hypothetical protein
MPDYAKALKYLQERADVLRGQMTAITNELDAIRVAQKAIGDSIENEPRPKQRTITTIVLPPSDPTSKPN